MTDPVNRRRNAPQGERGTGNHAEQLGRMPAAAKHQEGSRAGEKPEEQCSSGTRTHQYRKCQYSRQNSARRSRRT